MAEDAPAPEASRSRRVYLFWAIGLGLLLVAGMVCWSLVPLLKVRTLTAEVARTGAVPGDAIERLGGEEQAAAAIAAYLRSPRCLSPRRAEACYILGHCGRHMIPALRLALAEEDAQCRGVAIRLANHLGSAAAGLAPEVIGLLDHPGKTRLLGVHVLGSVAPRHAQPEDDLLRQITWSYTYSYDQPGRLGATREPSFPTLAFGVDALWAAMSPETAGRVVTALARLLGDADKDVRAAALGSLRSYGPGAAPAVPALVKLLAGEDDVLRINAAAVLAGIGPEASGARAELAGCLRDPSEHLRLNAAVALIAIDPDAPGLRELLKPVLEDGSALVRDGVTAALEAAGKKRGGR